MKKLFSLFFILFLLGALSAQNLNFRDTNSLKILLCSKTWIRYYVNPDSTFSDRVMDSIKFYKNGGFYQSARPKDDTINDDSYLLTMLSTGKCSFGSTGKTSRSDTATDCIKINGNSAVGHGYGGWPFALVDGHRIVGSKRGGIRITIDGPFIIGREGIQDYLFWDKRQIWQPRQQFKKTKQK